MIEFPYTEELIIVGIWLFEFGLIKFGIWLAGKEIS